MMTATWQEKWQFISGRRAGFNCVGAAYPVVVAAVDVPGHAEVSNLNQEAVPHQAIAGCQISVHEVLGG